VLLWSSRAWTTRDKWIGTLVVPGGLVPAAIMALVAFVTTARVCTSLNGVVQHCTGGSSGGVQFLVFLGLALLVIAPITCAIYLGRRAR